MSDSHQEVTSVSWLGRIKSSIGGLIFGLMLVALMVGGLFWNEGRAVQTARSLAEGAGSVVSTTADNVDPANDGKLVHVTGPVTTTGIIVDPELGIGTDGLRLSRIVEMYQWKEEQKSETKKKLGGGEETVTTYSYSKVWDKEPIDTAKFKKPGGYRNPPMEIQSKVFQISDGNLGAFVLDQPVLDRIGGDVDYAIPAGSEVAIDAHYTGSKRVSLAGNKIYLGFSATSPMLGDYRIGYRLAPLGVVSIVARQTFDRFEPYQTAAGDPLLMVATGDVPADKMFTDAVTGNTLVTWGLRGAGLLLLGLGFGLFLGPIGVILDVIPILGSVARLGTNIIATFLAVLVGSATIAIAWFWYRPMLAAAILAAGLITAAVVYFIGRSRQPETPAAAPAAGTAT